ncbi:hypothetical protein MKZ38_008543 [Zalerion maritima]|uniref:Transmembrane protein n=1 Tax=Zalerion maritima TaxID=339359 RepID=A0AAD5RU56_9PEZI|nr:hypothetical protein MKZ38_008543 [Zalerion maritima]
MDDESGYCAWDVPPLLHERASSKNSPFPHHSAYPFPSSYPQPTCPASSLHTTHSTAIRTIRTSTDASEREFDIKRITTRASDMMADDGGYHHYIFYIVLTALLLSLFIFAQAVTTYTAAYRGAPKEIQTFVDALDFSSLENDSYDHDVNRVQRMDDRIRLNRLLRDIQKCTDEFRVQVNNLTRDDTNRAEIRRRSRVLWAHKRPRLEESVRRLDLLRMRFLVVYMGIVANQAPTEKPSAAPTPKPIPTPPTPPTPQQLMLTPPLTPKPPPLPKSITEAIMKKPQLKKISTAPVTRGEKGKPKADHHMGWAGVIAELQKSPLLHKRHASIETAMAEQKNAGSSTPSLSPLSSSPTSVS